jgi:predicted ATPase
MEDTASMKQRSKHPIRAHNFRPQPTPFVGRNAELAEIATLLADPACRLLTLLGPGGIGKTRVAIEVASRKLDDFTNGVFFVNLQPVNSTEFLVSAMADAIAISLTGKEELLVQLLNFLHDKEMLLVLDNFEHLLDGVEMLTEILAGVPAVKLLVTSREALNLQEEWLLPVQGLSIPPNANSKDFEAFGAVKLFVERARRVRREFSLAEEWAGLVRICQLVEGMPLALELAAPWTKTLSCEVIADEIQRNLDFLATRLRNVPERHRSMRAALDYSWHYLSAKEQEVFKRLSVFQGGFGRAAAEQVAEATLPILTALVDKSLLRWEPSGRYQIHELLRQYAEEQLEHSLAEAQRTRDLHCVYYTDLLHQRQKELEGGKQPAVTAEIAVDLENVRQAWRRAVQKPDVDAMQKSASTLQFFYDIQGRYLEGATAFETAAERLDKLEPDAQATCTLAHVLVQLSWMSIRLGRLEKAKAVLERSQAIYNELAVPPLSGFASDPLTGLGVLANIHGNYAKATELGEKARRLNEARGDKNNLQIAHYVLANAAFARGEYEAALDYTRQAYATAKETGNRWFMAYVLSDLGNVARALGDYVAARQHYQTSYAIKKEFDDPEGMAVALNHLAKVALLQQNHLEAEQLYQQSLAVYHEINDRGGLATSLNGLGDTALVLHNIQAACQYLHRALQITVEMQFIPLTLAIFTGVGQLLLQAGQPEKGCRVLALVLNHSASDQETRDRARQCLPRTQAEITPEESVAVRQGHASDLQTVAATLLAELPAIAAQMDAAPPPAGSRTAPLSQPLIDPLTPRELEVMQLLADAGNRRRVDHCLGYGQVLHGTDIQQTGCAQPRTGRGACSGIAAPLKVT